MKRIISIILLLSLVGGLYAQKDASVEKRKIRPIVDLYIGTDYPFFGDNYELDYNDRLAFPYNAGLSVGVAFPCNKGNVLVKAGFMLDGWYKENRPWPNVKVYSNEVMADIDVLSLGYEGFVSQKFSLYGDVKMGFLRILDEWFRQESSKSYVPDDWKNVRASQLMGTVGLYYWFHSQWALNASLFLKMDFYGPYLGNICQPTIGTTVGVSFR